MNHRIRTLLCLSLLIQPYLSHSQFNEIIFFDTLSKASKDGYVHSGITNGKYIYLSGASFSQESPLPTITKLDTAGNLIWTAIDNDNYERFARYYGFARSGVSLILAAVFYGNPLSINTL
jgi:hypothetical protein